MFKKLTLAFLFCAAQMFGAWAHVASGTSTNSVNLTLNTTGATLLVVNISYNTGSGHGFFDSQSSNPMNFYLQAGTSVQGVVTTDVWVSYNPAHVGASHVFGASGTTTLAVATYSGTPVVSGLDQIIAAGNPSSGTVQAGAILPSCTNELVIFALGTTATTTGATISGGSSTLRASVAQAVGFRGAGIADSIQTTAASSNPTWSDPGGENLALSLSFREASSVCTGAVQLTTLLVAGGGGGGDGTSDRTGGGGGAGGFLSGTDQSVALWAYPVTVGAGGAANTPGGNSLFATIVSGGGGNGGNGTNGAGGGGSGGGGTHSQSGASGISGQGHNGTGGNNGGLPDHFSAGGGGGAGSAAGSTADHVGGAGGTGSTSSITGSSLTYACGGGGGTAAGTAGAGGCASAGNGGVAANGTAATGNTGSGGGGSANPGVGAAGANGIVYIQYATGYVTATGGTKSTVGSNTVHTFTSSGTFTVTAIDPTGSLGGGGSPTPVKHRVIEGY